MSELDALVDELRSTAERLRSGGLEPDEAAAVVEQLASAAARLGSQLEREAQAATPGGSPGQETLL